MTIRWYASWLRDSSILCLVICLAGCQQEPGIGSAAYLSVSPVYASFNPKEEFERLEIEVDEEVDGGRISPRELYGWRPLQGSLVLPPGKSGCEFVALAVRRALEQAVGEPCVDELRLGRERGRGRPLYGMLRYAKQGMRGRLYLWLFPDEAETSFKYAILLHEMEASETVHNIVNSMDW